MKNKSPKVVRITENKLVDLINDIVQSTINENNVKKTPKTKKVTVTESQLRELQAKGAKINSIVKKTIK